MNRQIKRTLLLVSILALLASACDVQPVAEGQPANAQGVEPPAGAHVEVRPISEGNVSDADQEMAIESSQAAQAVPGTEDANQALAPEDIPNLEERDAMLDGVNRGGLVFPESEQAPVSEGPAPGTESVLGSEESQPDDILDKVNRGGPVLPGSSTNPEGSSVNPQGSHHVESAESSRAAQAAPVLEDASKAVVPEDIPSLEERDAILDGVNRGGLVFPESEQAPVGEGPAPGTESILGPGEAQPDDILDRVNRGGPVLPESEQAPVGDGPAPGTESVAGAETAANTAEEAGPQPLSQFLEMLRNWLQVLLD